MALFELQAAPGLTIWLNYNPQGRVTSVDWSNTSGGPINLKVVYANRTTGAAMLPGETYTIPAGSGSAPAPNNQVTIAIDGNGEATIVGLYSLSTY